MTTKTLNLDSMTVEELWNVSTNVKLHPRTYAKVYGLTVKDMRLYGHYAANKATAMRLRQEGRINDAMEYERICENIYNRMNVRQW